MENKEVSFDDLAYRVGLLRGLNETSNELMNIIHNGHNLKEEGYEFERLFDDFSSLNALSFDESRRLERDIEDMQSRISFHEGNDNE
ncbi:hypothetical protein ABVF11_02005 [Pediococcus argentinicus]|uniref:hypothetical protein n=1 Tax=Pediococcus argentinicus TaxID=480391 RepID=UPI00338DC812